MKIKSRWIWVWHNHHHLSIFWSFSPLNTVISITRGILKHSIKELIIYHSQNQTKLFFELDRSSNNASDLHSRMSFFKSKMATRSDIDSIVEMKQFKMVKLPIFQFHSWSVKVKGFVILDSLAVCAIIVLLISKCQVNDLWCNWLLSLQSLPTPWTRMCMLLVQSKSWWTLSQVYSISKVMSLMLL
jgi:hypothetical protein